MYRTPQHLIVLVLLAVLGPGSAQAELLEFTIHQREPFARGKAFGDTGPYEKIVGVARFALDPAHPRNSQIVDLKSAKRNRQGKVEFRTEFFILAPRNPRKGNGAILYDVNNRGRKLALRFFNDAPGTNNPSTLEHAGNGFLFRKGYTVVWCGWIGELLPGDHRLLLAPPLALGRDGKPLRGVVRYEMFTDQPAKRMPLSQRTGHGTYPPTARGLERAVLTWRMRETDPRIVIPRGQWSIENKGIAKAKGKGLSATLPEVYLRVQGGFRPGYLYELVCEADRAIVQGTGFAAVRDLISWLRYEESPKNPLSQKGKSTITRAHAFGVSQSGRFLRHFLYLNFNSDESGRKVFDGLMPHVAGGGLGSFHHRFAQPTRFNGQHEGHLYPADVFPFTYGPSEEMYLGVDGKVIKTGRREGILQRVQTETRKLQPKVMHTQSAAEYWHRSGSLVHTDPLGKRDVEIPEEVRIYAFGGTQHGPASYPPTRGIADNLTNPGDYRPFLRALLEALDAWVRDGKAPPASAYPRIDQGTLVDWRQKSTGFPAIPGVRYPEVIQQPPALDFGPLFRTRGIITTEPPRLLGRYVVLVPKSGPDGNDLGTLLPVEVQVPVATYTGWNLRRRDVGAEAMLANLLGSYLPFPRTPEERKKTGDPRLSLEARYGTYAEYQKRWNAACANLQKQRYLLAEDVERLKAMCGRYRGWFPGR